jgi:hypothetical protein
VKIKVKNAAKAIEDDEFELLPTLNDQELDSIYESSKVKKDSQVLSLFKRIFLRNNTTDN